MKPFNKPRTDLFFLAVFLLLAGAYIIWTWNHELAGMGGDNAVYLLTAKYFSPWSSSSDLAEHFALRSQYPPLYPLLLGLFGGGDSVLMAHLITTGFLLLILLAFRTWLLTLGIGRLTANLAVILFALLPGTVKTAMFLWSENLFLLFTLFVFALTARFEEKNRSLYLLAAAFLIIGATLTRTAGISLVAAFLVYLLFKRPKGGLVMGLLATFPVLISILMKYFGIARKGTGYLGDFIAHYREDPASKLIAQINIESNALWKGWVSNFEPATLSLLVTLFLILCLMGLVIGFYQRRLDSFYLFFYFLIILVWPYPAEAKRLMYAVIPILMGQGILFISQLARLTTKNKLFQPAAIFLFVLLVISLPGTIFMAQRFIQPVPPELENYKRNKYFYLSNPMAAMAQTLNVKVLFEDLRSLDSKLPTNALIYGVKPSIIAFHANRLALKAPDPNSDWDSFFRDTASDSTYFYLMGTTSPANKTPYYPLELIRNRLEILYIVKPYEASNAPMVAILARVRN